MASELEFSKTAPAEGQSELPYSLILELTVSDPETIDELAGLPEGEVREQFARQALRIGVLALRQARGQLDGDTIRRETDRLLEQLHGRLNEHSNAVQQRLTSSLREYFDPESGRFQERVDRLVRQDGELEQVLRRQVGQQDSELTKTLVSHFGDESPLMKLLSPEQSNGILASLKTTLAAQLTEQSSQVLKEFSLDNREGALSRFITELGERHGRLSKDLQGRIDEVIQEFSLDQEDSAISRLIRNVERAQKTITSEFSLDEDQSALSRLKRLLENTNQAIESNLSLDDEQSALARLKRELLTLLKEHDQGNRKFQEEVKATLHSMQARKQEADRSTQHGMEFEDALYEYLHRYAQDTGDICQRTGNSTGRIKNCKIGDYLLELGPECAAAGARITLEAKEKTSYDLSAARTEIERARKNRDAQIGIFVFSKKTAPAGLEPISRYGSDVFVVWDAADAKFDLYLKTGLTLGKALCVRKSTAKEGDQVDFSKIDEAILEIEKRAAGLGDIETWTQTIQKRSEDILKRIRVSRQSLEKQASLLQEHVQGLKERASENEADAF